jgi:hypothetical protein
VWSQGVPVPGANIQVENLSAPGPRPSLTAISDQQGRYSLELPGPGLYRTRVEMPGFTGARRTMFISGEQDPVRESFELLRVSSSPSAPPSDSGGASGVSVQAALLPQEAQSSNALSAASSPPPAPPAASSSAPEATAEQPAPPARTEPPTSALSADVPTEFVFLTGQVAQPVATADTGPVTISKGSFHGAVFYNGGDSALDADPYALRGVAAEKPQYRENSFGASFGGPLSTRRNLSFFLDYSGSRSAQPFNAFANVPTLAERGGDFSADSFTIFDPSTGLPFPGNIILPGSMSSAALGMLDFMPLPNQPGPGRNFRFVRSTSNSTDGFSASLTRVSSAIAQTGNDAPVRHSFTLRGGYRRSSADLANVFPSLGGATEAHNWNTALAYTVLKGFFSNTLRVEYRGSEVRTHNRFSQDEAALLGVTGVSPQPFDWGLPSVVFAQHSGLVDVTPGFRADRNLALSEALSWTNGRHNLKWGAEFRHIEFDTRSSLGARGIFLFTGFATGSDWADFLLGRPQKTRADYSPGLYRFAGNAWSLFFVDDWRIAKNLTLNLGVRYEYVSPFSEARRQLATLDAAPDFSQVAVVTAGEQGPFSGLYPGSVVRPDRNNIAPRLGLAWRAPGALIVRAGYAIHYDATQYGSLAQRLAYEPPFAVAQTNLSGPVPTPVPTLTLENGFPAPLPAAITNDFAVPREFPLGYAQVWVLEVERELPRGFTMAVAYTGTKGTHLARLRAPNRTATGLLLPDVAPFLWEETEGSSVLHAGSVRLRKRLSGGLSFALSYMFSRSIDDVPSLGGDRVPQDETNIAAERALSNFDQRHRFTAEYTYQLPLAKGKQGSDPSGASRLFGDWVVSGALQAASGTPFTPYVVGDFNEVNQGGFSALRADLTGQPIGLPDPGVSLFFNPGAFDQPLGPFGNAGRNIIRGPGRVVLNGSLQKSFQFAEGRVLLLRIQTFNVLNTPQFTAIDTNLNSLSFGQIVGVGPMRTIQFSIRYQF